MVRRTTLILDRASRDAARDLAAKYDCSVSEAIRRAIVRHRDAFLGVTDEFRARRTQALSRLFELFEDHDAQAELDRLKAQDEGF